MFLPVVVPAALADQIIRIRALDLGVSLAFVRAAGAIEGALRITATAGGEERENHQEATGEKA